MRRFGVTSIPSVIEKEGKVSSFSYVSNYRIVSKDKILIKINKISLTYKLKNNLIVGGIH